MPLGSRFEDRREILVYFLVNAFLVVSRDRMLGNDEGDVRYAVVLEQVPHCLFKRCGHYGNRWDALLLDVELVNYQPFGAVPSIRLSCYEEVGFRLCDCCRHLFARLKVLGDGCSTLVRLPKLNNFDVLDLLRKELAHAR